MQAIAAYFEQRSCRSCSKAYTSDGIELVRQEPGAIVVKVSCSHCGQPLGLALVGVSGPALPSFSPRPVTQPARKQPFDWTKRDLDRLSGKPKISYDDLLEAHEFFQSLGADWSKHLPKIGTRRAKVKQAH